MPAAWTADRVAAIKRAAAAAEKSVVLVVVLLVVADVVMREEPELHDFPSHFLLCCYCLFCLLMPLFPVRYNLAYETFVAHLCKLVQLNQTLFLSLSVKLSVDA